MKEFADFVRSLGVRPRKPVVPDGRWHRCPTENHPRSRNGAYKLALDGAIGWVQDWAVHSEPVTWRPDGDSDAAAVEYDPAAMKRAREKARREKRSAMLEAAEFYGRCRPLTGGHPYLTDHGLTDMTGCFGLRVDSDGWLVVPATLRGKVRTVQRIAPDGTKRFWKGAPVKGAAYPIRRRQSTLTVLCEGLATGIALYACLPTAQVVVAFNAGNMAEVAPALPRGFTVVASDNDHGTAGRIGTNPGLEAAQEAAAVLECGVAVPECRAGETDWCDVRQRRFREELEKKREHTPESVVRRSVDGEIRMEIMRHASFRSGVA